MAYKFTQTKDGNIQVSDESGEIISTGTPQNASQTYGYKPTPDNPAPQANSTPNNTTVPQLSSNFGSSAIPAMTMSASAAQTSAAKSLAAPDTPAVSHTLPTGQTITPNGMYQYKQADGTITSIGDPTINKDTLSGATFLSGPTGKEANPLQIAGSGGSVTPLPPGYKQSTPDTHGNITITDNTGRTVYSGTSNGVDVGKISSVAGSAQSQVNNYLGAGYGVTADSSGNLYIKDAAGQTIGSIDPSAAADPNALSQSVRAIVSHQSTVGAINSTMKAELATLDSQLQEEQQKLTIEQDSAVGEELAGLGAGALGSGGGAVSGVKQRYDQLNQDLKSSYEAERATILSNNATALAGANKDLQTSLTNISESSKQTVISTSQFAQQQAQNLLKNIDLPVGQLQGLKLDANGSTGNASVDAVMQQFIKGGMTPQQALALTQSGSITQLKANQAQWIAAIKNFVLPDMSKMTFDQAKQDPFIAALIKQGSNVMGDDQAAFKALQSGSLSQLQAQKLQAQTLEVQALTLKTQIEAALAPEKVAEMNLGRAITESNSMSKLFSGSQPGKALGAIQTFLPNIDSAYKSGGKGVSALTAIDALVKIDTGGQAIRQGQTNLLTESGTWGDSASKFMASLGLPTNTGANVVLSPQQMQQIYNLAHQTAAEKIKQIMPAYQSYKTGIQTLQVAHPDAQAEIQANSQLDGYDSFFSQYGTDLSSGSGNISAISSSGQSILDKYGIK